MTAPAMATYDFAIVGGGIVGLSTAVALTERYPGAGTLVLEKEDRVAAHQSGRNSGVIHSGIYYAPGSAKASLAARGNRELVEFCRAHGIDHEICGKVIVATTPAELPGLESLHGRGLANGVAVKRLSRDELRDLEPHVEGVAALYVPGAGIVDFRRVAAAFAGLVERRGGEVRLRTPVRAVEEEAGGVRVESERESFRARFLVNCAGLHSDRIARLAGVRLEARIVPFRGEYYAVRPGRRHLVKHLVYPVPDRSFPFLGVHFTRMIDGGLHAGPNAVLALRREGYRKGDVSLRHLGRLLRYRGFWKLAARHGRTGAEEMWRSLSKHAFTRSLRRLVPEIAEEDLVEAPAGVRAQALGPDGRLVDDFLIVAGRRSVHVCNAPSPAATASLPIGRAVVRALADRHPSLGVAA